LDARRTRQDRQSGRAGDRDPAARRHAAQAGNDLGRAARQRSLCQVRVWRRAAWYRGTQRQRDGHIKAGGVEKDVHFEDAADAALNDAIDAAYRSKYLHHGAQWVDPMIAAEARATTIKLVPR
jgi:uncharacterized protein DUF2255